MNSPPRQVRAVSTRRRWSARATAISGSAATLALMLLACLTLLLVGTPTRAGAATPPAEAIELRNLGLAQLENEKPEEAAETFRRITRLVPDDPLGPANLAIALHRQQQTERALEMVKVARELSPRRADLLLLEAEIHAWGSLDAERALALYQEALALAPTDPEVVYALYRQAESTRGEQAQEIAREALQQLTLLRPDNLVVLLRSGVTAIEQEDRRAATAAWLRVRELLWQPEERLRTLAERELGKLLTALEENKISEARIPAIRLENLLKSTPTYRSSLVELFTDVRGLPVWRFEREPEAGFGSDGIAVAFTAAVIDPRPTAGRALLVADLDGDRRADIARLRSGPGTSATVLELRTGSSAAPREYPAQANQRLAAFDLDNSGRLDLIAYGGRQAQVWLATAGAEFTLSPTALGLRSASVGALEAFDFDSEGDLDLVVSAPGGKELQFFRNNLAEDLAAVDLESITAEVFPPLADGRGAALLAIDLDQDGDQDLLTWGSTGISWFDNLRQGQFRDRTTNAGLAGVGGALDLEAADLDNDGQFDLILASEQGLRILRNRDGRFRATKDAFPGLAAGLRAVLTLDADNDGALDVATCGAAGVSIYLQREQTWQPARLDDSPAGACLEIAREDLDQDGDLDLISSGSAGLVQWINQGGHRNGWLRVQLQGLTKGNDKNNFFGRGALIQVRAGSAEQTREAHHQVTHFGLGKRRRADNLRVVWANGVPQNRIQPQGNQLLVEEQVLKGSCPFVYTWNGETIEFVTDLLWNAPLGMPVAPGIYAASDPRELVRLDGAVPRDLEGRQTVDLRITEELWEAAYFDRTRLWVVDHPEGSHATSSLRVFARIPDGYRFDQVRLVESMRPVAGAWDGQGHEVTQRVAGRDEIYADGYPVGDYQGVAAEPWSFTFDLGEAPGTPIRLVLDGWVFPSDASLNLAVAQRPDLAHHPLTTLEVETSDGWQTLLPQMGFPAGKTKTMVVDTPPLPAGAHRLRIRTSRWLHWDRIAWTTELGSADARAKIVAQLLPRSAELRFRGFSRLLREAPNAPHSYDYSMVETTSPWQTAGGRYTRFGDVLELLTEVDDRLVVMAPGDEIALHFDVTELPPSARGMQRTYLLESHGWDKDFDRNTWQATSAQPLPFTAMDGYPSSTEYPRSEALRRYDEQWLTRSADSGERATPAAPP